MTSDERDPDAATGTEPGAGPITAPSASTPMAAPANPFVPRYREPWINPAKRTPAILLGVASAVALLALGLLIGLGLGGGHHHEFGPHFDMRDGYGYGQPDHGYGMWRFRHPGYGPGFGPRHGPVSPSAPAPTPVPSSSHR